MTTILFDFYSFYSSHLSLFLPFSFLAIFWIIQELFIIPFLSFSDFIYPSFYSSFSGNYNDHNEHNGLNWVYCKLVPLSIQAWWKDLRKPLLLPSPSALCHVFECYVLESPPENVLFYTLTSPLQLGTYYACTGHHSLSILFLPLESFFFPQKPLLRMYFWLDLIDAFFICLFGFFFFLVYKIHFIFIYFHF